MPEENPKTLYERIYDQVRLIPSGKVSTYGRIARFVGPCTARMVGYAMSALKDGRAPDVPWHRVINSQGKISMHGMGNIYQRTLLMDEGILFDEQGQIDLDQYLWESTEIKSNNN